MSYLSIAIMHAVYLLFKNNKIWFSNLMLSFDWTPRLWSLVVFSLLDDASDKQRTNSSFLKLGSCINVYSTGTHTWCI